MLKQKQYDWKDTNVFAIGSDEDMKARYDSAETEKAWDGVGEDPELRVWRVEKFKIKAWDKSKYGQFHTGDSYIILHTYKESDEKESLSYDIFFWIGAESSQDEYGTAAYKTVELDNKLHDKAIQHREVQNHESEEFKALFDSIEYLPGGVESGFNHVGEPETKQPELFRVKGVGEKIEFKRVDLRRDKMNSGDVFVLDNWLQVFQWNGAKANPSEKRKASEYIDAVLADRGADTKKFVFDQGQESEEFWAMIPGEWRVGCVPLRTYKVQDEAEYNDAEVKPMKKKLYRLTTKDILGRESQDLRFAYVTKGDKIPLKKMKSDDVYVIDDGMRVWVWIGSGANSKERGGGVGHAMRYIKEHKRPPYMPITQIKEGQESAVFKTRVHTKPLSCLESVM